MSYLRAIRLNEAPEESSYLTGMAMPTFIAPRASICIPPRNLFPRRTIPSWTGKGPAGAPRKEKDS